MTDIFSGMGAVVLGLVVVRVSGSMELLGHVRHSSGFVPSLLGYALIGLGLALMVAGYRKRRHNPAPSHREARGKPWAVPIMILVMYGYAFAMGSFGFLATSVAFLIIANLVFGYRKMGLALVSDVLFVGVVYYVFVMLLKVPLR